MKNDFSVFHEFSKGNSGKPKMFLVELGKAGRMAKTVFPENAGKVENQSKNWDM
jgi:hypothetical protein